jgi:hypothetical protein
MAFNLNSVSTRDQYDRQVNFEITGRPVITNNPVDQFAIKAVCLLHAISVNPVRIDLGKCNFCKACSDAFPDKIHFGTDYQLASNVRDRLVVLEREDAPIAVDANLVRNEIKEFTSQVVKLKLVADGESDSLIINSDLSGSDILFVDDIREAHGLVISSSFIDVEALDLQYHQLLAPKIIVLIGRGAISAYDALLSAGDWPLHCKVDLFVAGDPVHPTVFKNGLLSVIN